MHDGSKISPQKAIRLLGRLDFLVNKLLQKLRAYIYKDLAYSPNQYSIEYLRDRIFRWLAFALVFLVGPSMFYGAYLFLAAGLPHLALVEIGTFVFLLIILHLKSIHQETRKFTIVTILYFFCILLLLYTGNNGAGMVGVIFTSTLAITLLDRQHSLRWVIINAIIFILLTVLLALGSLDQFAISNYKGYWLINAFCVQMCILIQYGLWNTIYDRLSGQIERFDLAINGSNDGIWDWNFETQDFYFSPRWKAQLGYTDKELPNAYTTFLDLIDPQDRTAVESKLNQFRQGHLAKFDFQFRMRHKDGSLRWIRTRGECAKDKQGWPYRIAGSHTDITPQVEAARTLAVSEEKYRTISENTTDTIWVYNLTTKRFTFASPSIQRMLGYRPEEILAVDDVRIMSAEFIDLLNQQLEFSRRQSVKPAVNRDILTNRMQIRAKDGNQVWIEFSASFRETPLGEIEAVGVSRDITDRIRQDAEIQYFSQFDPLTGLRNANSLRAMTASDIIATDTGDRLSVFFIDIDNFRMVNESLGQTAGDRTIAELAQKLQDAVGTQGTLFRKGSDEFVVITQLTDSEAVQHLARDILKTVSSRMTINGRLFILTASIGICLAAEARNLERALNNADTALFVAKKSKNIYTLYNAAMDQVRTRENILSEDMQPALTEGQFELYFQPVYDVKQKKINQAEALLRWNHPEFGMVSPGEFIPIAENSKFIIPLTDWIIRQACTRIAQWEKLGIQGLMVSINLSFISFENRGAELTEFIACAMQEAGIDPNRLKLEITESTLMNNAEEVIKDLNNLKELGLKLALDDFGTGYSSFGYLKDLPIDIMKLDRSLVRNIMNDARERMIVEAMIDIIHRLGLEVVVEGIETLAQFQYMKDLLCDHMQGYLFSRPLQAIKFIEYYYATMESGDAFFTPE